MTLEPFYIRIRQIENVKYAYLGLEGTVLLFGQRRAATDSELQIPVELIAISQGARFNGGRLIAALLSLLFALLAAGATFALLSQFIDLKNNSIGAGFAAILIFCLFFSGLIAFIVFLILFFRKVHTVHLTIGRDGGAIEFYKPRRQAEEIDDFIAEIEKRQALVSESLADSTKRAVGFTDEHSLIPRLAGLLCLSAMPAIITEKAALLLLTIPALLWFAHRQVQYRRQPKEYRRAIHSYLHKDFEAAIDALERLRRRLPEYVPTYFFLAEALTRSERFDEALTIPSFLAHDFPDVARKMETDIWLFKRLYQRRQPST